MRGLIAVLSLFVAMSGLLVVIAYGGSEAYYSFRGKEASLYEDLLLESAGGPAWSATELTGLSYDEQFVTPCLRTPLLNGVGIDGRGAAGYRPSPAGGPAAQVLVVQTSLADSRAIMADLARDTENNCQRGVTVGTIERADADADRIAGADEAVFVSSDRRIDGETQTHIAAFIREGDYVAQLTYEMNGDAALAEDDIAGLASSLASRMNNPPTTAQLEAAGFLNNPSTAERIASRANEESTRVLSSSDRIPIEAGLALLGGIVLLTYFVGARLSRTSDESLPRMVAAGAAFTNAPTLDNYGTPERRWITGSVVPRPEPDEIVDELVDESELDEHVDLEQEPEPAGPPPVLEFPQKPIQEKLKILKEARMKEPRREHRAMREIKPEVDWTEEISRPERGPQQPVVQPQPEPVTRKALLKKLRSQQPEGN